MKNNRSVLQGQWAVILCLIIALRTRVIGLKVLVRPLENIAISMLWRVISFLETEILEDFSLVFQTLLYAGIFSPLNSNRFWLVTKPYCIWKLFTPHTGIIFN
ncbi:MAG: hypothetical protein ACI4FV_07910, partial [Lachnospiraceae bacterium]